MEALCRGALQAVEPVGLKALQGLCHPTPKKG